MHMHMAQLVRASAQLVRASAQLVRASALLWHHVMPVVWPDPPGAFAGSRLRGHPPPPRPFTF